MNHQEQKEEVAYFMRRLYSKGLTTTSGGNISLKIGENQILLTASQTDKGRMAVDDIGLVDFNGKSRNPDFEASMETGMHLAVFKARKDVQAIVHAHPVFATAFGISAKKVNCNLMGEARAICGEPATAAYKLMGTAGLANEIAKAAIHSNIILMQNHGVLAVGKSLLEAFDRLEVFEASAKLTFITGLLGDSKELTKEELGEIDALFG
ncbi:MAG: class II aldolase/adducin family protein [Bacteroidales bacterium]|nr:class II aldolase/adducin family protein [Bacteroidales bacterium]